MKSYISLSLCLSSLAFAQDPQAPEDATTCGDDDFACQVTVLEGEGFGTAAATFLASYAETNTAFQTAFVDVETNTAFTAPDDIETFGPHTNKGIQASLFAAHPSDVPEADRTALLEAFLPAFSLQSVADARVSATATPDASSGAGSRSAPASTQTPAPDCDFDCRVSRGLASGWNTPAATYLAAALTAQPSASITAAQDVLDDVKGDDNEEQKADLLFGNPDRIPDSGRSAFLALFAPAVAFQDAASDAMPATGTDTATGADQNAAAPSATGADTTLVTTRRPSSNFASFPLANATDVAQALGTGQARGTGQALGTGQARASGQALGTGAARSTIVGFSTVQLTNSKGAPDQTITSEQTVLATGSATTPTTTTTGAAGGIATSASKGAAPAAKPTQQAIVAMAGAVAGLVGVAIVL